MKRKDYMYTKSCNDFRKDGQCFIKIFIKKSKFNVSEEILLILKDSGLLK